MHYNIDIEELKKQLASFAADCIESKDELDQYKAELDMMNDEDIVGEAVNNGLLPIE